MSVRVALFASDALREGLAREVVPSQVLSCSEGDGGRASPSSASPSPPPPPGAPAAPAARPDETTLVVLRYRGQVYAYRNVCPHRRVPLNWRPDGFWNLERTSLMCAMHGALFAPETGECLQGPCVSRHLEPVLVLEQDGVIYWERAGSETL